MDILGDNINSAVVSFVERLSTSWRFIELNGDQLFCREVYYTVSEGPLEVLL